MNTKTITLHAIDNCGSCLQAYALQQFLLQHGVPNEIIDYRPPYSRNNGRPLRHQIKKLVFGKAMRRRSQVFDSFVRRYLRLTPETYTSGKALERAALPADVFIAGSDQIWNEAFPCGRDSAFYLSFVQKGRRVAYAPSTGGGHETGAGAPSADVAGLCDRIRLFDAVSVREKSAADALRAAGIAAEPVCDPVLLHERAFYETLLRPDAPEDYILVYLIPKSALLDAILERVRAQFQAQGRPCRVIYVGSFLNRCACDVNLTDAGPEEFVTLIAHAACVIAGSFHATVFSCLFHRPFVTLPYANNGRMKEFLEAAGLPEHFIETPAALLPPPPDWNRTDRKLRDMREASGAWLLEAVRGKA